MRDASIDWPALSLALGLSQPNGGECGSADAGHAMALLLGRENLDRALRRILDNAAGPGTAHARALLLHLGWPACGERCLEEVRGGASEERMLRAAGLLAELLAEAGRAFFVPLEGTRDAWSTEAAASRRMVSAALAARFLAFRHDAEHARVELALLHGFECDGSESVRAMARIALDRWTSWLREIQDEKVAAWRRPLGRPLERGLGRMLARGRPPWPFSSGDSRQDVSAILGDPDEGSTTAVLRCGELSFSFAQDVLSAVTLDFTADVPIAKTVLTGIEVFLERGMTISAVEDRLRERAIKYTRVARAGGRDGLVTHRGAHLTFGADGTLVALALQLAPATRRTPSPGPRRSLGNPATPFEGLGAARPDPPALPSIFGEIDWDELATSPAVSAHGDDRSRARAVVGHLIGAPALLGAAERAVRSRSGCLIAAEIVRNYAGWATVRTIADWALTDADGDVASSSARLVRDASRRLASMHRDELVELVTRFARSPEPGVRLFGAYGVVRDCLWSRGAVTDHEVRALLAPLANDPVENIRENVAQLFEGL